MRPVRLAPERGVLHNAFEVGLVAKGLMGLTELAGGAALAILGPARVQDAIAALARWQLIEDMGDPLPRRILVLAGKVSPGAEHFYAFYLLAHGVLKIVMVTLLWRRLAIAYPAAMVIQSAFVAVSLERWSAVHNPLLLVFAALDATILLLIWHEWRAAPARRA